MKNWIFFISILFLVFFSLKSVKAEGSISLIVETEGASTTNLDFGSLETITEEGTPLANSSELRVKVTITNTTGCQYKVTQRLGGPILNERGIEISPLALTFFTFGSRTQGRLLIQSPVPVSLREEVIFISDTQGKDDTFQIQYNFTAPLDTKSGRYSSNLIYCVTTIE